MLCLGVLVTLFVLFIMTVFAAGVSETLCFDMSNLAWSVVTTVQGRMPLASEVCSVYSIYYYDLFLLYLNYAVLEFAHTHGMCNFVLRITV